MRSFVNLTLGDKMERIISFVNEFSSSGLPFVPSEDHYPKAQTNPKEDWLHLPLEIRFK